MRKILVVFFLFILAVIAAAGFILLAKNNNQVYKNHIQPLSAVILKKSCPAGFILVPGNNLYQTSDFCVMKYDAKCANIVSSNVGLNPQPGDLCSGLSVDGGYAGVYKNNGKNCACNAKNNKEIVSTKAGFPITYIPMSDNTQDNAKAYCQRQDWHVITNNEWMTIARNVEQVSGNWCDKNGTNCGFAQIGRAHV